LTSEADPRDAAWGRVTARGLRLAVRVQPRASRDQVAGVQGEAIKVRVTPPPVGGAANDALVAVLADWLDLPRGSIALVQGASARAKVVEIETDQPEKLRARVAAALQALVDTGKKRA
jgi:uncharacterized protein (TIGR00251 family)